MEGHIRKVVSFFVAKREKMQNNLHMSNNCCTFAANFNFHIVK